MGRTIEGQGGCGAPGAGVYAERVYYRLSMYWAANLMGYKHLLMGADSMCIGLALILAIK